MTDRFISVEGIAKRYASAAGTTTVFENPGCRSGAASSPA